MRRVRFIPLFLFLVSGGKLRAQWQLTGEAGISRLRQAGLGESNALTLGASVDAATERAFVRSSVLGALAGEARWTGQWLTIGSVVTPAWKSAQLQITGALSAFGQTTLRPTTSADILAQARVGDGARGVAIGGGVGTTSHNAVSIPLSRAVGDGWCSIGEERFSAEAALTRTRSVFGESSILVDASRRNADYVDLTGGWRHESGSWSVGAIGGLRTRTGSQTRATWWQSLEASVWIAPRAAVAVSAGHTLEDLVRGVPRTQFAGVALRIASRSHGAERREESAGPRIVVSRTSSGTQRIEVRAARAARVELMADFTAWNPVALARVGDVWRLEQAIGSGLHRVAIRIDGGAWIVPANLPRVEDDLGGSVGLITVP